MLSALWWNINALQAVEVNENESQKWPPSFTNLQMFYTVVFDDFEKCNIYIVTDNSILQLKQLNVQYTFDYLISNFSDFERILSSSYTEQKYQRNTSIFAQPFFMS